MTTPTNREELHDMLEEILGNNHVYFDPPEGFRMKYPAIVYHRNIINSDHADNVPYKHTFTYTVTLIDEDPDSETLSRMINIPTCKHNNHFTSAGMNHDVFTIKI